MNIYDALVLVGFFVCVGLTFIRLYNVMRQGKLYQFDWTWFMFFTYLIFWLLVFVAYMSQPTRNMFLIIYQIVNFMLVLNVFGLAADILFHLRNQTEDIHATYEPRRSVREI